MNTAAVNADISTAKKLELSYMEWHDLLGKMERLDAYEINVLMGNLLALQTRKIKEMEAPAKNQQEEKVTKQAEESPKQKDSSSDSSSAVAQPTKEEAQRVTKKRAASAPRAKKKTSPTQSATPLEAIKELAEKYDNYVPIYEYRAALSHLTRKQQDDALYALQRQDEIELSSLVDPTPYTSKQIREGIKQDIGGPIFFVMLAA